MARKKFSVQSADFYRLPLDQSQVLMFQAQFIELFCECDPAERSGGFSSLEEAIAEHERQFGVTIQHNFILDADVAVVGDPPTDPRSS